MNVDTIRKYMSYPNYFRYTMTIRWYRSGDKIVLRFK